MTPEFLEKFNTTVETIAKEKVLARINGDGKENKTPEEIETRTRRVMSYEKFLTRKNFYWMWNNKETMDKDLFNYLKENEPLFEPEFTEVLFEDKREGIQNRPRIEWEGKIMKTDDIIPILGVKTASTEDIKRLQKIKNT